MNITDSMNIAVNVAWISLSQRNVLILTLRMSCSDPALVQQNSPSIGNDRPGMLILTASQASITPESSKRRAAALHGRSLDKENFRRPFDLMDDELRASTGADFPVAHKLAWGRRNMTASTMVRHMHVSFC